MRGSTYYQVIINQFKQFKKRECTALHHAAQSGHASIVEDLIKAGCDLNARDKNEWTPLMNACYWANQDAALVLLKSGAESNLKNIVSSNASSEILKIKQQQKKN